MVSAACFGVRVSVMFHLCLIIIIIPPANCVCGRVTVCGGGGGGGILFSRCPSVHPSIQTNERKCVRNVLFLVYLEESLMEFHQTLQKLSYVQGKYYL